LTEASARPPTVSSGIDPAAIIAEGIGAGWAPGGQDERYMAASQLVAAPYRYEQAARIPLKMTVSELKHQDLPEIVQREADGSLTARGIGLSLHGLPELTGLPVPTASSDHLSGMLPANRLGTLLHAVIRFLDLAAARKRPDLPEITRQLAAMRQTGIFNEQEAAAIELHRQDLLAFVQSELAGEMDRALANPRRPIYQEMPFTLAVPACQVHAGCPGLGLSDRVLVQGIIDCWFEGETGVTLVDFKSDRLSGDPDACRSELKRRYESQLEYYARAIQAATGKLVTRRLIWMIRQARAYELTPTGD
jgi:ATP-dependent helicase/nuclease subunit A